MERLCLYMESPEEMKIDAYKNLNKDCISLRSRESDNYGLVVDHVDSVLIRDVEFVVSEDSRQRVIDEERKNVHAVVRGKKIEESTKTRDDSWTHVTYNPYKYDSFVISETEEPIEQAEFAFVTPNGVFVP